MNSTNLSSELPLVVPDLGAIRAAIDATDERARLLRRLLRVSLRLRQAIKTERPLMPSPPSHREAVRG